MENEECAAPRWTMWGASATTWRSIEKEFRGKDRNIRYQKRLKNPMLHCGSGSKAFAVFSSFLVLFGGEPSPDWRGYEPSTESGRDEPSPDLSGAGRTLARPPAERTLVRRSGWVAYKRLSSLWSPSSEIARSGIAMMRWLRPLENKMVRCS